MIFQAEKMIKDNGEKLPADLKTEVETALTEAKTKLSSDDIEVLKKAREELETRVHKLAEALYKNAGASAGTGPDAGASGGAGPDAKSKDDVVDAEYEEGTK